MTTLTTSQSREWDGMESLSGSFKLGMLLDLDEGTLSVYNNGRKLGVMKRGLASNDRHIINQMADIHPYILYEVLSR